MKKYRFEIQSCIEVEAEGETADEARIYADQMVTSSCYVSDGVEL